LCSDTPRDECDAESNMWEMVYSHDNLMNTIDGSLEALTEGLRNGAEVKVWSPFYGLTNIQKSSIHSIINDEPEQEVRFVFKSVIIYHVTFIEMGVEEKGYT
jgi:hypothetical protein